MKITIPFLVAKQTAGGIRYYWTPSPALRKAGWTPIALGRDGETAQAAAKQRNIEVDTWRNGGARPREVAKIVKRQTFAALIAEYEASSRFTQRAPSTQREYRSCLRALERWAGEQPVEWITRQRVQVLKRALMTPATPDGPPRYARARNVLAVLFNVMQVAFDADRIAANPVASAGVEGGPPRDRVAAEHEIAALLAAAGRLGRPSVATGILMAIGFGQRQGDLLRATWAQWRGGRLRLRQGKTKVWVEVRAIAELRERLDALFAEHARQAVPIATATILVNENTGLPWASHAFQVAFRAVKAEAIAPASIAGQPSDVVPVPELEDLEFRDFRRTAVVRLAEAEVDLPGITAITGHKIERAKKIIEVYMPRTTPMADAAIARLEAHQERAAEEKKVAASMLRRNSDV